MYLDKLLVRAALIVTLLAPVLAQDVLIGELSQLAHQVSGTVYAVDDHTLRITNFNYDGLGPAAVFWLDEGDGASSNGVPALIKEDCSVPETLPSADGDDEFIVELPGGRTLSDYGYFSVWCEAVDQEFGGIALDASSLSGVRDEEPTCVEPEPSPVLIGPLSELEHDVSGTVFALNNRQLRITGLTYDGLGPAGQFWVGTGSPSSDGQGVPFRDSCEIDNQLPAYNGDVVDLELPDGMTLSDIDYLSIWCEAVSVDFGSVKIDADALEGVQELDNPNCSDGGSEMVEPFPVPENWNCEELSEDFQVRWVVDGDNIKMELVGRGVGTDRYMGFGPSGSDDRTNMVGSDVVIAYRNGDDFAAVDYYMSSRQPCVGGQGVCPDEVLTPEAGTNDVSDVSGEAEGDLTRIVFTRSIAAADSVADRPYSTSGQTFISWATGPLDGSSQFLPLFHQGETNFPRGDVSFDFTRTVANNCPNMLIVQEGEEEAVPGFIRPSISNTTEITARIGPPGGARGYAGITQGPSWGFAWYMSPTGTTGQDVLIPAIAVERGKTYTFTVQGGVSDKNGKAYHPFYITDSIRGGYNTRTPQERAQETVYAGIVDIVKDADGAVTDFTATATGALCDITSTISETEDVATWDEYAASLNVSCAEDPNVINNSGELKFTVPDDAPDTLYYQCVTHQFLGYKLVVFDADNVDLGRLERENGGGELNSGDAGSEPSSGEERVCKVTFDGEEKEFFGCRTDLGPVEVYWTVREDDGEIDTLFRARADGYVGFGWGYDRMVGSNAAIIWRDGNGGAQIDDYELSAQNPAGVQPRGNQQLTEAAAAVDGDYIAGMFTRKLAVEGLPELQNGDAIAIWAMGPPPSSKTSLEAHEPNSGSRGDLSINLKSGAASASSGLSDYFTVHAALMTISWLFLTPTAVLIMSHLKGFNPLTFQLHRGINVLSVLVFIAAYIMGLVRGSRTVKSHLGIGSAVFVLAILQVIGGAIRPHKGTANRRPWYFGHAFLGTSAIILAYVNAGIGINEFDAGNSWWIAYGVFIGLNVVANVILIAWRNKLPKEEPPKQVENVEAPATQS